MMISTSRTDSSRPIVAPQRASRVGANLLLGLATIGIGIPAQIPAQAENINHLQQLLSTKACTSCDLQGAGLVMANLPKVQLSKANLEGANLSRSNLQGADLRGSNLMGASLYGANLGGADLRGADLRGADLRNAYLGRANLTGAYLDQANLYGAIGLPSTIANADTYQTWGLYASQRSRHQEAIDYYNQAIALNPKAAPSYLGRSLSLSVLGDTAPAIKDAQQAEALFKAQNNPEGAQAATDTRIALEQSLNPEIVKGGNGAKPSSGSSGGSSGGGGGGFFSRILNSVVPLMLKFVGL
jgi:uncharacterized protein YjbI with pentapeptide repeats